jgi:hypothetical protein
VFFSGRGWSPRGEIARLDAEIARLQAAQMVHVAAHVAAVAGPAVAFHKHAGASAFAEINLVLGGCGRRADARIGEACALAAELPRTLAAVCAGEPSAYRASVILNQTCGLSGAELATAEDRALAIAAGLSPATLRQTVARLVARINPDAVLTRRRAEQRRRYLAVRPSSHDMAYLSACLPAEEARAIFGIVDTVARARGTPGDQRSVEERAPTRCAI